jgi:hypothetical protein
VVAAEARVVRRRTLAILSVVVVVLAAVVVVDRPAPPPDPGLSQRVLDEATVTGATRVRLVAPGRPEVVLERAAGSPASAFRLVAPVAAPVDGAAALDLVGTLEYLSWRRRVPAGDAAAAAARGLGDGARVVVLEGPGGLVELRLGKREAALGRTWVARPDARAWYLVDDYFGRALDRGADDLRRRDPLPLPPDARVRLVAGERTLELGGGVPATIGVGGAAARAVPERVSLLFARLADVRAARFLDAPPAAPGPAAAEIRGVDGALALVVYGACPGAGGAGERLAESSLLGWVCVRADVVDWVAEAVADPMAWVERAPLPLGPRDARAFTLAEGGRELRLVREGGGWQRELPGGGRAPVDDETMGDWLRELASFQAVDVVPAPALAAPPTGAPTLRAELEQGEPLVLWIEPGPAKDRVHVRRPGEALALVVHADLARYLEPAPIRFHEREVLAFEPSAVRAIEVTREDGRELVARGATLGEWIMTAPAAGPADLGAVDALREAAAHLEARRAVAERPGPEHGLDPPRRTLVFELDPPPTTPDAPPVRVSLELGARAPGGCYARRGGDPAAPVFLLDAETCAVLETPLAGRVLVARGDPAQVVVNGSRHERHGPGWYGPDGARLADDRAGALTTLVTALIAPEEVLGYGAPARGRARVEIVWADGTRSVFVVASPAYALEGRPVRYRVPQAACEAWPTLCR